MPIHLLLAFVASHPYVLMGGFIQAALMAAPYVLNALGGVFGRKKKYIDPEELRRKYGPRAIAQDAQQLQQFILNSPYGQQLLATAAEQGQGLQTDMASRLAGAGLSPDSGGQSGAGDFAASAATQAQAGLERGVKSDVLRTAMPIAANMEQGYQQQAIDNQAQRNLDPSTFQKIAAASGQLAAGGTAAGVGAPHATVRVPGELTNQDGMGVAGGLRRIYHSHRIQPQAF